MLQNSYSYNRYFCGGIAVQKLCHNHNQLSNDTLNFDLWDSEASEDLALHCSQTASIWLIAWMFIYRCPFPHMTNLQQTTLNIFCQKIGYPFNYRDFLWLKVKNIVVKGEIACFEQFVLLSLCFQKAVCCSGVGGRLSWSTTQSLDTVENKLGKRRNC